MTNTPEIHDDEELTAAVDQLVRVATGDDDDAYVPLFLLTYRAAHSLRTAEPEGRQQLAAAMLEEVSRRRPPTAAAAPDGRKVKSLQSDPVYLANQRLVTRLNTRITNGGPTQLFPDCVAVGNEVRFCCTGTLIAANVVVSAAHCPVKAGCDKRIFIGANVAGPGRVVDVAQSVVHPDYPASGVYDDLVVLILAEPVEDVAPRKIAAAEPLSNARTTRLVGFGNTDFAGTTGYGQRQLVDVGIASDDPDYGARPQTEFVAGAVGLDKDSCTGDSGGPAYIDVDGEWQLAGATSRGTSIAPRTCGDGGIYTRVHAYVDWIESVAGPLP
jgi:V8-like Glu-specific endopeptidase